jgi:hypothetical protein
MRLQRLLGERLERLQARDDVGRLALGEHGLE